MRFDKKWITTGVSLTLSLIESLSNDLQLGFEFDILRVELLIGVLQQCLKVLDSFVTSEELAICESEFSLESRVLLDELGRKRRNGSARRRRDSRGKQNP